MTRQYDFQSSSPEPRAPLKAPLGDREIRQLLGFICLSLVIVSAQHAYGKGCPGDELMEVSPHVFSSFKLKPENLYSLPACSEVIFVIDGFNEGFGWAVGVHRYGGRNLLAVMQTGWRLPTAYGDATPRRE